MRLGNREVGFVQRAGVGRRQEQAAPRPAAYPTFGFDNLAQGLGRAADVAGAVQEQRDLEAQQRDKFAALERWEQTTGEFERRYAELGQQAPADGKGFEESVAKEWQARYNSFAATVPPDLLDEFAVKGAAFRENALTQATEFSRSAARGYALTGIETLTDELKTTVYQSPEEYEAAVARLGERVAAAPLSEAERTEQAKAALRGLSIAAVNGKFRQTSGSLTIIPGSPAFDALINATFKVESNFNPEAVSPKGATGIAQSMPLSARDPGFGVPSMFDVARAVGREVPDESDATLQQIMRDPDVSARWGQLYMGAMLQKFGGDVELALIAYNAGHTVATQFQEGGRDYTTLSAETQAYIPKVLGGMGVENPDAAFARTAVLAHLTFDDRMAFEQRINERNARALSVVEKTRAAQVEAFERVIEPIYQEQRKQVFRGNVSEEEAVEQLNTRIDADPNMTPEERADAKARVAAGMAGATLANVQLRRTLADPDVSEFADDYAMSAPTMEQMIASLETEAGAISADRAMMLKKNEDERKASFNGLLMDIRGGGSRASIDEAYGSIIQTHAEYAQAVSLWEETNKEMLQLQGVVDMVERGLPLTPEQENIYSRVFTEVLPVLESEKPVDVGGQEVSREDAFRGMVMPGWESSGALASSVRGTLDRLSNSRNWADQKFAYGAYAAMLAERPDKFASEFGEDKARDVAVYTAMAKYMDEKSVQEMLTNWRDPTVRAEMRENGEKLKALPEYKAISPEFITDRFNGWGTFFGARDRVAFETTGEALAAAAAYKTFLLDAYTRTGDWNASTEVADTLLQSRFGPTQNRGLVEFPIEQSVPAIDGGHSWLDEQVREDVEALAMRADLMVAEGMHIAPLAERLPVGARISYVPTRDAEQRRRAGKPLVYNVLVEEPQGDGYRFQRVLPNWQPDPVAANDRRAAEATRLLGTAAVSNRALSAARPLIATVEEIRRTGVIPQPVLDRMMLTPGSQSPTVEQAVEFLERSIEQLKTEPKSFSEVARPAMEFAVGGGLTGAAARAIGPLTLDEITDPDSNFMRALREATPKAERPYPGLDPRLPANR